MHFYMHVMFIHECFILLLHLTIIFMCSFWIFKFFFLQSLLFSFHTLLNCISQSSPRFLHLAVHLPSSRVVALISVLDGPVPALLKAWTTTPYWANFFRLSKVYTSLSPVAFISTILYWPLLPGPFSLYPIW